MSALPPIADVNEQGAGGPLVTQLGHSRGFESNGCLRPETVIHWDHAQGPLPDQKAVIRANFYGAQWTLLRLGRLCDLGAEAIDRLRFRRLVTLTGHRGLIRCSAIDAVAANCGVRVKRVGFACV